MKTAEYIKKYKLDTNLSEEFNRKKFMNDFSEEYYQRIFTEKSQRESFGQEFSFKIFQEITKQMGRKFWSISNKKRGLPFSMEYFNRFYALVVLPLRKQLFPIEDKQLRDRYQKFSSKQD